MSSLELGGWFFQLSHQIHKQIARTGWGSSCLQFQHPTLPGLCHVERTDESWVTEVTSENDDGNEWVPDEELTPPDMECVMLDGVHPDLTGDGSFGPGRN
jgi:hypothetical protein